MSKIKGKQIQDNSIDLSKLAAGSKILPDTATLGTEKSVNEITDSREFVTKEYVDSNFFQDYNINWWNSLQLDQKYLDENKKSLTLPTNFNFVHGFIYLDGYLYAGTRTNPARLAKIDAETMQMVGSITFPTGAHHQTAEQISYSKTKNKLYIVHLRTGGTTLTISEIDPVTLAYTNPFLNYPLGGSTNFRMGFPSSVCVDDYLYILNGYNNGGLENPHVLKIDLNTYTIVGNLTLQNTASTSGTSGVASLALGHCIQYDGTNLYLTSSSNNNSVCWVAKVDPVTLTQLDMAILPVAITDDMAILGEYIYIGPEPSPYKGHIFRIKKSDLKQIDYINTGVVNTPCHAVYTDGKYIWACFNGNYEALGFPGVLVRFDPNTFECVHHVMPSTEDGINEIVSDGYRYYLTTYTSPSNVIRYTTFPANGMVAFAGSDGNVKYSIDKSYGGLTLYNQKLKPNNPNQGLNIYADDKNRFAMGGTNGYIASIDQNNISSDRSYILPDKSGTIAIIDDLAGNGLSSTTSGIVNINTGSGISIESDTVVLDIKNYEDPDKISITTTNGTSGISLSATESNISISSGTTVDVVSNGNIGIESSSGMLTTITKGNQEHFSEGHFIFDNSSASDKGFLISLKNSQLELRDTNSTSGNGFNLKIVSDSGVEKYDLQLSDDNAKFTDSRGTNGKGIEYGADYSLYYTSRSLVDKQYVDNKVNTGSLNQMVEIDISGFGVSGTSGVVSYLGSITFISGAKTDADVFINGMKIDTPEMAYFGTSGNSKPDVGHTLYFDISQLGYDIETDDRIEIKYYI